MRRMTDRERERLREYYERQLRVLDSPERSPPPQEVFDKRMRVWRHNSFFGFCAMSKKQMQMIIDSATTSKRAKQEAASIIYALNSLAEALKERID